MMDKITFYQKKLRLSQSLIDIYKGIEFESKDQFILELLESLYLERQQRIIQRNLKAAHFPSVKTFEGYSFTGIQFPEKMGIDELISLEFINQQKNLIFYGGVGTGKTHLSIALGIMAETRDRSILTNKLIANARATRKDVLFYYYRIADGLYNTLSYARTGIT